jgi:hypothetical protein
VPLSHTIIYVVGSLYLALYFSLRVQDKIINFRVECSNISCRRTKGLIRRSLTYGFQSSGKLILNGLFKKLVNGTFCIRPGNNQSSRNPLIHLFNPKSLESENPLIHRLNPKSLESENPILEDPMAPSSKRCR